MSVRVELFTTGQIFYHIIDEALFLSPYGIKDFFPSFLPHPVHAEA
jgi:hypothetical protein